MATSDEGRGPRDEGREPRGGAPDAATADGGPAAASSGEGAGGGVPEVAALLDEVRRCVAQARRNADGVPLGYRIGAEVDAIVADLRRLEAAGPTEGDRPALEALAARARKATNRARRQRRDATGRRTQGTAGLIITDRR